MTGDFSDAQVAERQVCRRIVTLQADVARFEAEFLEHVKAAHAEVLTEIRDSQKLSEATGGDNHIETVWGRGYVLRDPEKLDLGTPLAASA